jgi:UDP-GlcNAc:undecaprenyl-phosphate/decaprenyl-phosphate GlcNAc-1-phosphate transferase
VTNSIGLLIIGSITFAVTALLVPLARRVALAYGITDKPHPRKLHRRPTPYLGGVAIVVAAVGAWAFLPQWDAQAAVILAGGLVVGIVGLIDDVRTLGPVIRVVAEIVAALLAAAAGARAHLIGGPLDWIVTAVWLVVITNSFNLLDNMDGVAGMIATTTAVALVVAAGLQGQWLVGSMAAVLAGSCLGFLLYNWHPARIFMGDAGSLFLGFLLGSIALKLRFPVSHRASLSAVLLLTGPALFDTTLVVLSRLHAGTPIYLGGTDHSSHRLLRLGLTTRTVASILALACVASSSLGVAVGRGIVSPLPVLSGAGLAAIAGLAFLLRLPATTEEHANDPVLAGASA